jgi:hypothetical protein
MTEPVVVDPESSSLRRLIALLSRTLQVQPTAAEVGNRSEPLAQGAAGGDGQARWRD